MKSHEFRTTPQPLSSPKKNRRTLRQPARLIRGPAEERLPPSEDEVLTRQ
jgi:hypothetical protein